MLLLYLFVCNLRVVGYSIAQNLSAHLSAHVVGGFLGLVSSRYARSVSSVRFSVLYLIIFNKNLQKLSNCQIQYLVCQFADGALPAGGL